MTGEVIPLGRDQVENFDVVERVGEVRGVAVEVWQERRPGGGLRVVLTPTAEGFSTVALFPPNTHPIAERLGCCVVLALEAVGATWSGPASGSGAEEG